MAATMTAVADDAKKRANAVVECTCMGVLVYGPDVHASQQGFTVENGGIRFGLLAIKGIGEGPIQEILRARGEGGPFTSLGDFCTRVDPRAVGKGALETLIKAGAMDSLGDGTSAKRHLLLHSVESAMKFGKSERVAQETGLISLFGEMEEVNNAIEFQLVGHAPEIPRHELLNDEKELLGLSHPASPLLPGRGAQGSRDLHDRAGRRRASPGPAKGHAGRHAQRSPAHHHEKKETRCVWPA